MCKNLIGYPFLKWEDGRSMKQSLCKLSWGAAVYHFFFSFFLYAIQEREREKKKLFYN
jgi:hypothetical protein